MTLAYLDTSAAMKLLVDEAESAALAAELSGGSYELVASWMLHTELHCAAGRNPALIPTDSVRTLLETVTLVDVTRGDLLSAGTHTPLRAGDAIHLATALRIGADTIVTYDAELAAAGEAAGLRTTAPA
ncbi:MAG: type II toxin-antitoxin system VapC family toxin [Actinobacteria bacterium]|nr:type II toxin-antitoxin system VapC family toxin [Actinomycetota bacterium]